MPRIGLTQRVDVLQDRGERRDCLDQAWYRLLLTGDLWPIPLPNTIDDVDALLDELALDGIILTGGNDLATLPGASNPAPERDRFEARLLDVCRERDLPVLGVCRGLQMMVAHYGGRLTRISGHVRSRHPIQCGAPYRELLSGINTVNSYHEWGIRPAQLGTELEAMATAPDGTVEAVIHRHVRQMGIMWHPERCPLGRRGLGLIHELFTGNRHESHYSCCG